MWGGRLAYFLSNSGNLERTAPSHIISRREQFGRCCVKCGLELDGPELPCLSNERRKAAIRELSCEPDLAPPVCLKEAVERERETNAMCFLKKSNKSYHISGKFCRVIIFLKVAVPFFSKYSTILLMFGWRSCVQSEPARLDISSLLSVYIEEARLQNACNSAGSSSSKERKELTWNKADMHNYFCVKTTNINSFVEVFQTFIKFNLIKDFQLKIILTAVPLSHRLLGDKHSPTLE